MVLAAVPQYLEYFDEVAARFPRNGNPLLIPKTSTNPTNVLSAFGKYNAIGFSPFFIELGWPLLDTRKRLAYILLVLRRML